MRLHISLCFHCVGTDNVHKTRFYCEITRFSAFSVVFAKQTFKHKEMLVLALVSLTLHHSIRLHVYHCFHCVETDNVHKTHFQREITRFSAFNVVFAEYSRLNAKNCFFFQR